MADHSFDVVIAGGGIIGSAVAYFLSIEPGFSGRVAVVERDPTYRIASTTLSAASIRQQFSTPENIAIGLFGADFLRRSHELLSVDGHPCEIGFVEGGYLFLATEAGVPVLRENHALQRRMGADNVLLDPAGLRARFPWLHVDDLALGCLGLSMEGWFDPHGLLQGFRRRARANGVTYLTDEVVGLERDGNRIAAVRLKGGDRISCGTLVNAAGAWAGRLAALADIPLSVEPRKRFVYMINCREPVEPLAPLLIDPTGIYFRPEGKGFICGMSPPPDEDGPADDLEVDYRPFEEVIWPVLAQRVPAFEAIKLQSAWAGFYDYNPIDHNGIVGRHPDVANLVFANGFSGHGLQQSPAVGRGVAELIAHGAYRSLDLTRFAYERFAAGRLIIEKNVV